MRTLGLAIVVTVIVLLALICGVRPISSTITSHEGPEYEVRNP
jgi:hypothetical protein